VVAAATPKSAMACTAPIQTDTLAVLFVDALLICILGLGIPTLMAAFAGSGIHLALEHFAAARYLGAGAMRTIAGSFRSLSQQIDRMRSNNQRQTTLQQRMNAGAQAAARVSFNQQPPPPASNAYDVPRTQNLASNGAKPTSKI
jgi:hypothetical protein